MNIFKRRNAKMSFIESEYAREGRMLKPTEDVPSLHILSSVDYGMTAEEAITVLANIFRDNFTGDEKN